LATKKLTSINILCYRSPHYPTDDEEHAMPTTATPEIGKPARDTDLLGHWQVEPHTSHARFAARTLAGLVKTSGRFRSISGRLVADAAPAAGALVIDPSSIDTGNRIRDRHLRSRGFFDVARHPQLRYEARSVSRAEWGRARIDGELIVAGNRTHLPLDVSVRTLSEDRVELACETEVDRLALGVRAARMMVPRAVQLDVAITLRRVSR
jgi:polyisoprenoid-binding protein YceI